MGKTAIEWADVVWNPVTGCSQISKGCKNCYAKALHDMRHQAYLEGKKVPTTYLTKFEDVKLHPERLEMPYHWKKARRVFVNSMSDLFHPDVPKNFIDNVFAVMALNERHTFMVLTKRPERMLEFVSNYPTSNGPIPNIWLGVSVENQKAADERIPLLLQTPAAVRFVSCEPLLGRVDLNVGVCPICGGCGETAGSYWQDDGMDTCDACGGSGNAVNKIDWVICGGESGIGARVMHPDWARSLRDQCVETGTPFFFKQWGEWLPDDQIDPTNRRDPMFETHMTWVRVGKRAAGRVLDGRTWDERPEYETK